MFSVSEFVDTEVSSWPFHPFRAGGIVKYDFTLKTEKDADLQKYFLIVQEIEENFVISCLSDKTQSPSKDGHFKGSQEVSKSGFVAAFICSPTGEYSVTGDVEFINAHGYLEAGYYGFLGFSFWIMIVYGVAVSTWVYYMLKWKNAIMFHHHILMIMLLFSFIDEGCTFTTLYHANKDNATVLEGRLAACLHAFKEAAVRFIGLSLAFGFGMAYPENTHKLIFALFSALHFILSLLQCEGNALYIQHERTLFQNIILTVMCFADALWATVLINALQGTYADLIATKQFRKAKFYKTFGYLFGCITVISCIFIIVLTNFLNSNWRFKQWRLSWWFMQGCWRALYVCVLMFCIFLYKPTETAKYVVGGTELPQNESDAEEFELALDELEVAPAHTYSQEGENSSA